MSLSHTPRNGQETECGGLDLRAHPQASEAEAEGSGIWPQLKKILLKKKKIKDHVWKTHL